MIIPKQLNLRLNTDAVPKKNLFLEAITLRQGYRLIFFPYTNIHTAEHTRTLSFSQHINKNTNIYFHTHVYMNHLIYRMQRALPRRQRAICMLKPSASYSWHIRF